MYPFTAGCGVNGCFHVFVCRSEMHGPSVTGEADGERGAGRALGWVGIALDDDVTAVHLDDPIRDAQSQARPFARLFGGEERFKNLLQSFLFDAGSRVTDTDPCILVVAFATHGDRAG